MVDLLVISGAFLVVYFLIVITVWQMSQPEKHPPEPTDEELAAQGLHRCSDGWNTWYEKIKD